jgi:aldose sugar dehydrogenase
MKRPTLCMFLVPLCIGCAAPTGRGLDGNEVAEVKSEVQYRVETVVQNVQVPWAIVWDPEGRMIFTERPGRVRVFEKGKLREEPLHVVNDVRNASESGLMGLCLHPDYSKNHYLYLSYAYGTGRRSSGGHGVRVVRFVNNGTSLKQDKVIVDGIPGAPNHAGCRIKFGPDKKLYVTAGDSTDWNLAQKLDTLAGKILRINDDGSVPEDNPFVGKPGVRPEIWVYGSRNAQGIDWHPDTGLLVETEHGPSGFEGLGGGGDEVNIVDKGANLGWPTIHHRETRPGMVSPLLEYSPAVAPASGMFYKGRVFKEWRGNYFFGNLVGRSVIRVVLNGRKVVSQEKMLTEYGRIRDVAEGPDGYIYFSTSNRDGRGDPASNDDRIMRLVPR